MTDRGSLPEPLETELKAREADAFVHVGPSRDPDVRYCLGGVEPESLGGDRAEGHPSSVCAGGRLHAVAFDGSRWYHAERRVVGADQSGPHPAAELATHLADAGVSGTVLTPASIPHDAALYLEQAEFSLASSDVLIRARRSKSEDERTRIERAQKAAASGMNRAGEVLVETNIDDDGTLTFDGDRLTSERLRTVIDGAIVSAGALPAGLTGITSAAGDESIRAGEPIVVELAPRGLEGYHGGLTRTFVVDGDGGHRRAHVALTRAFRSVRSKLTDATHSVTAVEADLEAEIRAFGFGDADGIETEVTGVGLEPREAPAAADADVGPETVVRIEASVRVDDDRSVRLADLLVPGEPARWLESPSQSLDPTAYD